MLTLSVGLEVEAGASAAVVASLSCFAALTVAFMVAIAARGQAMKPVRDILKNDGTKRSGCGNIKERLTIFL
jgi:hypothetical protein